MWIVKNTVSMNLAALNLIALLLFCTTLANEYTDIFAGIPGRPSSQSVPKRARDLGSLAAFAFLAWVTARNVTHQWRKSAPPGAALHSGAAVRLATATKQDPAKFPASVAAKKESDVVLVQLSPPSKADVEFTIHQASVKPRMMFVAGPRKKAPAMGTSLQGKAKPKLVSSSKDSNDPTVRIETCPSRGANASDAQNENSLPTADHESQKPKINSWKVSEASNVMIKPPDVQPGHTVAFQVVGPRPKRAQGPTSASSNRKQPLKIGSPVNESSAATPRPDVNNEQAGEEEKKPNFGSLAALNRAEMQRRREEAEEMKERGTEATETMLKLRERNETRKKLRSENIIDEPTAAKELIRSRTRTPGCTCRCHNCTCSCHGNIQQSSTEKTANTVKKGSATGTTIKTTASARRPPTSVESQKPKMETDKTTERVPSSQTAGMSLKAPNPSLKTQGGKQTNVTAKKAVNEEGEEMRISPPVEERGHRYMGLKEGPDAADTPIPQPIVDNAAEAAVKKDKTREPSMPNLEIKRQADAAKVRAREEQTRKAAAAAAETKKEQEEDAKEEVVEERVERRRILGIHAMGGGTPQPTDFAALPNPLKASRRAIKPGGRVGPKIKGRRPKTKR